MLKRTLTAVLLLLCCSAAWAQLTEAQKVTLKAAIVATPALNDKYVIGDLGGLADALNQPATPAFIVWRTVVTKEEWRAAILGGGGATQLDALTASKRDSLLWAVSENLNPSNSVVRAALDDFCGSQNILKASILAAEKRSARLAEKILATGTGSDASPATMGFEGVVSYTELIGL